MLLFIITFTGTYSQSHPHKAV